MGMAAGAALWAALALLAVGVLIWAFDRDFTATQKASLSADNIATVTWQHLLITLTLSPEAVTNLLAETDANITFNYPGHAPVSADFITLK